MSADDKGGVFRIWKDFDCQAGLVYHTKLDAKRERIDIELERGSGEFVSPDGRLQVCIRDGKVYIWGNANGDARGGGESNPWHTGPIVVEYVGHEQQFDNGMFSHEWNIERGENTVHVKKGR